MRLLMVTLFGLGLLANVVGCSSSSNSGGDNQPKLAKPPDPKLAPAAPGGAGAPKPSSQ